MTTFKVNVLACVLFVLGAAGMPSLVAGLQWPTADDALGLLVLTSPVVVWSAGAWILRRHLGASLAWAAVSIVLMALQLAALYADVEALRHERLRHEETMHFGAFLAMLLHWFVALTLFALLGGVCLLKKVSAHYDRINKPL